MNRCLALPLALCLGSVLVAGPATNAVPSPASAAAAANTIPDRPLSQADCLALALAQSPTILKGRRDIEEAHGVALQQRSVYLPRLRSTGQYTRIDGNRIEKVGFAPGAPPIAFANDQSWNALLSVSQPVFAGGRLRSAARASRLTEQAALAAYQALVSDTLLAIRTAYDDALLAAEQITTQEASIQLLERELRDTTRRYEAGTVPRFNVLRAEVELAGARPRLSRARNAHRIARNNLATQLGLEVPDHAQDIPLRLSDPLRETPFEIELGEAIGRGLRQRPELEALRTSEKIRGEEVIQARADYLPQVAGVAGYGLQSKNFNPNLADPLYGYTVGGQLTWDVWDFGLTRGRVAAARARHEKARLDIGDQSRRIELEVRTAHSTFIEAREVLASQRKVIEQAEEALRLANARAEAGSGTQLDVLAAQTSLTDARTTLSLALREYSVALARLERAMGERVLVDSPAGK